MPDSRVTDQTRRIRQALETGTYDIKTALDACDQLDKLDSPKADAPPAPAPKPFNPGGP